jgi:pantetheine-phosphate adenylyltransferase
MAAGDARIAVVPGSFDPVTLGHLDVLSRAARLFDRLHVVVVHNPAKTGLLPFERRMELLRESLDGAGVEGDIVIASWASGLLVDYCRQVGAGVLVKGIRPGGDMAYETPMAIVNRDLAGVETLFLVGDPATSHISSSLVRQVASLGGDIRPYVPEVVARALQPSA